MGAQSHLRVARRLQQQLGWPRVDPTVDVRGTPRPMAEMRADLADLKTIMTADALRYLLAVQTREETDRGLYVEPPRLPTVHSSATQSRAGGGQLIMAGATEMPEVVAAVCRRRSQTAMMRSGIPSARALAR